MRMIDADAVLDRYYAEFKKQDICDGSQDRDWLMRCIEEAPTLTQPNEPLTLEQLREMNGEPVWIEDVKHWALIDIESGLFDEAATALSTLQAENEKLRDEMERVKQDRDAARSDIETALAYGMKDCELCKNSQCYVRGGTKPCLPKWRGQKEG